MAKSIVSVVASFVIWSILWVGGGRVGAAVFSGSFNESGIPTASGILVGFIVYSLLLSILSGFVCAKLAPPPVMRHVLILGAALLLTGIGVQASAWTLMPIWYHLIFLALLIPGVWVGSQLAQSMQSNGSQPAA